jgi:hypothetical protein
VVTVVKLELDRIAIKLMWASGLALVVMSASVALAQAPAGGLRGNKMALDVVSRPWSLTAREPAALQAKSLATTTSTSIVLPTLGVATLTTRTVEALPSGNSRWVGTMEIANQRWDASLVLTATGAWGEVRTPQGRVRFEPDANQKQTVQLLPSALPGMEACASASLNQFKMKSASPDAARRVVDALSTALNQTDIVTIDVLFVSTPQVARRYGDQLSGLLDSLIEGANAAMRNSNTPVAFRAVGNVPVKPQRLIVGDLVDALKAVASSEDATLGTNADFSHISNKRSQSGADVVVMLTGFGDYSVGCSNNSECIVGAAFQASVETLADTNPARRGYAVVDIGARDLALTFVHELGHLLGAGHEREAGGGGLFADSVGFRWNAGNNGDIMSYAPSRELVFSNPEVRCGANGEVACGATGDATAATNNARAIRAARKLIADYRKTQPLPLPDMTGLWSSTSDSAQVHLSHRGKVITALLFEQDSSGRTSWLAVPNCLVDGRTCQGTLYTSWAPAGASGNALVPPSVFTAAVGTMTIDMSLPAAPNFRITQFGFSRDFSASRAYAFSPPPADDQTLEGSWWLSMYLGPGVAITRNGTQLHALWFGFDRNGQGEWLSSSDCRLSTSGVVNSCVGGLRRPLGAGMANVGSIALDFTSAYRGRVQIGRDGVTRSGSIERELMLDP